MLNRRHSTAITSQAIRNLSNNTPITFFGQGSIARTLVEIMANEIELLYDNIDLNLSQSKLATASGVFLDIIAQQFGLIRHEGSSGSILAEDKAVRFFTRSGRLIDYLQTSGPTSGVIPGGTKIISTLGDIEYETTTDVSFPANAQSVWVPVQPSDPTLGSQNNLPAGTLVSHSLPSPNILVENVVSMIVSSDVEGDDEFRQRISQHINARVTGSKTSVIQAAFSFPGVSDVQVNPFKFGAGSFELLLVPTTSVLPANVIARIKAAVENIVPFGTKVGIRGPDIVPVSLVISIDMRPSLLAEVKDTAIRQSRQDIKTYIGDIQMGGELIINRLRSTVLDSNRGIRDMRIHQLAIDCRPQVIANFPLKNDEVFDLDRQVQDPILVI